MSQVKGCVHEAGLRGCDLTYICTFLGVDERVLHIVHVDCDYLFLIASRKSQGI